MSKALPKGGSASDSASDVTKARLYAAGETMKIALSGRHNLQQLRLALDRIIDIFEQSGAREVQGVNLYLFLYRDGIPLIVEEESGEGLWDLRFSLRDGDLIQISGKPIRAKMPPRTIDFTKFCNNQCSPLNSTLFAFMRIVYICGQP